MKVLLIWAVFLTNISFAQSGFYESSFSRLNEMDFRVSSHFNNNMGNCYDIQYRFESSENDTLFLQLIFETRGGSVAFGCGRADTLRVSGTYSGYSYINVSTGRVTFDQNDPNIGDTLWRIYDSTFNAQLGIPEFGSFSGLSWSISNNELKVFSNAPLQSLELVDLNGKSLLLSKESHLDISFLESGVYLMRVLTGSGDYKTIRWFKP